MEKFLSKLGKFKDPVADTFKIVRDDYGLQFSSQGSYFGNPWSPLADRTKRERAALGFAPEAPIHVRTGGLGESIHGLGRGHAERVSTRSDGVTLTMMTSYTPNAGSSFSNNSSFEVFPTLNRLRRIRADGSPGFVPLVTRLKIIQRWRMWLINTSRSVFR